MCVAKSGAYKYYHGVVSGGKIAAFVDSDGSIGYVIASLSSDALYGTSVSTHDDPITPHDTFAGREFEHDGKTVYVVRSFTHLSGGLDYATGAYNLVDIDVAAQSIPNLLGWAMYYGEIKGNNQIPVQWMRSDGEMLEDRFSISVNPQNNNESNSSTSDSGSGHTSGGF